MEISDWHAHIYFPLGDGFKAKPFTEEVQEKFGFFVGRIWDKPVGPHPIGSCQITVPKGNLDAFLPWLLENRQGFDFFIHPNTGNDLLDHTERVMWIGKSYSLNIDQFKN